jgi:hypothetical protein
MDVGPAVAFLRASNGVFAEVMSCEALSGNGLLTELAAIDTATQLGETGVSSGVIRELWVSVPYPVAAGWLQCV